MKAMVFAAGLGTRLRPLTDNKPKALVEVVGIPMLQHVIQNLAYYGFHDIVINVHHFSKQIIDFLKRNDNFGQNIAISDESDCLLDTGGGILNARHLLDDGEPFLVQNSDILTNLDLKQLYDYHLSNQADATLLVAQRQSSRYLLWSEEMQLKGWINESTGEIKPNNFVLSSNYKKLAFGGIHVISPSVFKTLSNYSAEKVFSITPFYIDNCDKLKICGYLPHYLYKWHDIGSPMKLREAEIDIITHKK